MGRVYAAIRDGSGNGVFQSSYTHDTTPGPILIAVSTANAVALNLTATLRGICEAVTASVVSLAITRFPGPTVKTLSIATASAVSLVGNLLVWVGQVFSLPGETITGLAPNDSTTSRDDVDAITSSARQDSITSRASDDTIH